MDDLSKEFAEVAASFHRDGFRELLLSANGDERGELFDLIADRIDEQDEENERLESYLQEAIVGGCMAIEETKQLRIQLWITRIIAVLAIVAWVVTSNASLV